MLVEQFRNTIIKFNLIILIKTTLCVCVCSVTTCLAIFTHFLYHNFIYFLHHWVFYYFELFWIIQTFSLIFSSNWWSLTISSFLIFTSLFSNHLHSHVLFFHNWFVNQIIIFYICNYSHVMWMSIINHYTIAFQHLQFFSSYMNIIIIYHTHYILPTHMTILPHVNFYTWHSSSILNYNPRI